MSVRVRVRVVARVRIRVRRRLHRPVDCGDDGARRTRGRAPRAWLGLGLGLGARVRARVKVHLLGEVDAKRDGEVAELRRGAMLGHALALDANDLCTGQRRAQRRRSTCGMRQGAVQATSYDAGAAAA